VGLVVARRFRARTVSIEGEQDMYQRISRATADVDDASDLGGSFSAPTN
jgi:hypothetical protein